MTLPRARCIAVRGRSYSYLVKGAGKGCDGHGMVRLTVDLGDRRYLQASFFSKEWVPGLDERGEQDLRHGFTPEDVRGVVVAANGTTQLPADFDLPKWKLLKK